MLHVRLSRAGRWSLVRTVAAFMATLGPVALYTPVASPWWQDAIVFAFAGSASFTFAVYAAALIALDEISFEARTRLEAQMAKLDELDRIGVEEPPEWRHPAPGPVPEDKLDGRQGRTRGPTARTAPSSSWPPSSTPGFSRIPTPQSERDDIASGNVWPDDDDDDTRGRL